MWYVNLSQLTTFEDVTNSVGYGMKQGNKGANFWKTRLTLLLKVQLKLRKLSKTKVIVNFSRIIIQNKKPSLI